MTEIEIVGGDLPQGVWRADGNVNVATMKGPNGMTVNLTTQLKAVHELTEHSQASLGRIAASAAIGALIAGPLAALGGALLFGSRRSMSFVAELVDGRQFVGTIEKNRYPLLVTIALQNRKR